ncbi:MAG: hypothetical protein JWM68_2550 [Verrucomicrobiales bacterium]|nr:hypothetical protein [Verrucomicrobiales bacterium]
MKTILILLLASSLLSEAQPGLTAQPTRTLRLDATSPRNAGGYTPPPTGRYIPPGYVDPLTAAQQRAEAAKQKYLDAIKSGDQDAISAAEKNQKEAVDALNAAIAAVEESRVADEKRTAERKKFYADIELARKKSEADQAAMNEMLPLKYLGKTHDALGTWLRLQVENRSTNAVVGFQARCQLQNFFGETVLDAVISYDKTLPAQTKTEISVPIENNVELAQASSEKITMPFFSIHGLISETGEKKTSPYPLRPNRTQP